MKIVPSEQMEGVWIVTGEGVCFIVKENMDELVERCDKMRLLDEKHAEAQFIESKLKLL